MAIESVSIPGGHDTHASCMLCSTPSLQSVLSMKQATSFRSHRIPESFESFSSNSTSSSQDDSLVEYSPDEWNSDSDVEFDSHSFCSMQSSYLRKPTIDHPLEQQTPWTQQQAPIPTSHRPAGSKPSRTTKLLQAVKNINILPTNPGAFLFNERMTDDILPPRKPQETVAIPLQTFNVESRSTKPQKSTVSVAPVRAREPRINSNFLRVYALDYTSKKNSRLGLSDYEIDLYYQEFYESGLDSFDEFLDDAGYELTPALRTQLKLGVLSRDKLWNNVILPPRSDSAQHTREKYFLCDARANPRVRTSGKFVPWLNLQNFNNNNNKCVRPYGHISNQTQFTVNGWCNERWIAQTR
ncbi:hypothetical protein OGAPHI_000758 [Ogataea philodendri]|uniref:Uncharacterized protein n=1 Tax=Ogataea philodendri TaxID=1378263 RepID=A0A9P8PFS5_9ASCO|nr:uncharacterized protein OGAPHI_000758 [Ogataea philodendri]KAH3671047.1 hypothetical protein OGAPHI_000758 [Ogataea philodendri]